MNAKQAKKLRWYARAQEAGMADPMINDKGIPSTLLVYEHPRSFVDRAGKQQVFVNRTIQYNPRTSGKGLYRALKSADLKLKGNVPSVRKICQFHAIKNLTSKQMRAGAAARPDAEKLGAAAIGAAPPNHPPGDAPLALDAPAPEKPV